MCWAMSKNSEGAQKYYCLKTSSSTCILIGILILTQPKCMRTSNTVTTLILKLTYACMRDNITSANSRSGIWECQFRSHPSFLLTPNIPPSDWLLATSSFLPGPSTSFPDPASLRLLYAETELQDEQQVYAHGYKVPSTNLTYWRITLHLL